MMIALSSCANSGVDVHSEWTLADLEYANDVDLLGKNPSRKFFLDRLNARVSMFGMRFALSKR